MVVLKGEVHQQITKKNVLKITAIQNQKQVIIKTTALNIIKKNFQKPKHTSQK